MDEVEKILIQVEPLIKSIARLNRVAGLDTDDVEQELRMLVPDTYDKYKSELGFKFDTYFYTRCMWRLSELRSRKKLDVISLNNLTESETEFVDILCGNFMTAEENRLIGFITEILHELKYGDITISLMRGFKMVDIARDRGVTPQAINDMNKRNIKKIKERLGI